MRLHKEKIKNVCVNIKAIANGHVHLCLLAWSKPSEKLLNPVDINFSTHPLLLWAHISMRALCEPFCIYEWMPEISPSLRPFRCYDERNRANVRQQQCSYFCVEGLGFVCVCVNCWWLWKSIGSESEIVVKRKWLDIDIDWRRPESQKEGLQVYQQVDLLAKASSSLQSAERDANVNPIICSHLNAPITPTHQPRLPELPIFFINYRIRNSLKRMRKRVNSFSCFSLVSCRLRRACSHTHIYSNEIQNRSSMSVSGGKRERARARAREKAAR
jgi:hypothetical protein